MADVKESALTQKNDCKWVRALDENGNSIRISKEDLAEVVGGLLPVATVNNKGLFPTNTIQLVYMPSSSMSNFSTKVFRISSRYDSRLCKLYIYTDVGYPSEFTILGSSQVPYIKKIYQIENVFTPTFYYDETSVYVKIKSEAFGTFLRIKNLCNYEIKIEQVDIDISTLKPLTIL